MTGSARWLGLVASLVLVGVGVAITQQAKLGYDNTPMQPDGKWRIHDGTRPQPVMVTPGPSAGMAAPPSDAVVLLGPDGSLSAWQGTGGKPAAWPSSGGVVQTGVGSGTIETKESFGDVQLHVEFATPSEVKGDSQGRGNSGVFLAGVFEIQVLDSYNNPTYPDGQAAAMYGQFPPLVNASRPPGEWQAYDITLIGRRVTVVLNGQTVIDSEVIPGITGGAIDSNESEPGPLMLQGDHGKISFRNVTVTPAQ